MAYTVIARYDGNARNSAEFASLPKAKAWAKTQIMEGGRTCNNASIYGDDYGFKSLHASLCNGRMRWSASKL